MTYKDTLNDLMYHDKHDGPWEKIGKDFFPPIYVRLNFSRDLVQLSLLDVLLVLWSHVFIWLVKVNSVPLKLENALLALPEVYEHNGPDYHEQGEDHRVWIVDEIAELKNRTDFFLIWTY